MSDQEIRCVLLADKHHSLSEGIRALLQRQFDAVATVVDEASLVESAARMQPDVVVADLALIFGENFAWLRRLLARCPQSLVIVLSPYEELTFQQAAFDAGAMGFVRKVDISTQLLPAVNQVLSGGRYIPPEKERRVLRENPSE